MRKFSVLEIFILLLIFNSCGKEESLDTADACTDPILFNSDIVQIININCAINGCHISGGIYPELTSYEKTKRQASDIKYKTEVKQMPPPSSGKSLTNQEIEQIKCWVKQGTPE